MNPRATGPMAASLLAGALASALLAGCAGVARQAPASAPQRPLAAPAAVGERSVSQVVRGAVGARDIVLHCVVSARDGTLSVVGLNALGVRLFTVNYDGERVQATQATGVPEQLTPELLLADLQLVFWPLPALADKLRPAGYELSEPLPGTRRLRRGDRLVAEVHVAGPDPWSGRSWLVNLEYGYSLQIDSKPL
jgi:hypothetical protein